MARPRKYTSDAERQAAYRQRQAMLRNEQSLQNSKPIKPILRYFGGKWLMAKWIISQIPEHLIYVEPYGGGASVLLLKDRSPSEVFNDLDGEIVNLFRVLQRRTTFEDLKHRLRYTPFARQEFDEAYVPVADNVERARRLLIKSWMGHSTAGLVYRTGFRTNVVMNRRTWPAMDWRKLVDHIDLVADRFRGVCIEHRPATDVIRGHDSAATVFYVDPPYPLVTRYKKVYRHEMTDVDHRQLAAALHTVKGRVILSGYACSLYDDDLYPDWKRLTRPAYANGGKPREEVLWISPVQESLSLMA